MGVGMSVVTAVDTSRMAGLNNVVGVCAFELGFGGDRWGLVRGGR